MLSLHPFLHVNQRLVAFLPICLHHPTTIQVVLEVLHKNNLLLFNLLFLFGFPDKRLQPGQHLLLYNILLRTNK